LAYGLLTVFGMSVVVSVVPRVLPADRIHDCLRFDTFRLAKA